MTPRVEPSRDDSLVVVPRLSPRSVRSRDFHRYRQQPPLCGHHLLHRCGCFPQLSSSRLAPHLRPGRGSARQAPRVREHPRLNSPDRVSGESVMAASASCTTRGTGRCTAPHPSEKRPVRGRRVWRRRPHRPGGGRLTSRRHALQGEDQTPRLRTQLLDHLQESIRTFNGRRPLVLLDDFNHALLCSLVGGQLLDVQCRRGSQVQHDEVSKDTLTDAALRQPGKSAGWVHGGAGERLGCARQTSGAVGADVPQFLLHLANGL
jgi:hypothetical protein